MSLSEQKLQVKVFWNKHLVLQTFAHHVQAEGDDFGVFTWESLDDLRGYILLALKHFQQNPGGNIFEVGLDVLNFF